MTVKGRPPYYTDIKVNFVDGYQAEGQVLSKLGRVNLFVGPNNAGKSRFMRALVAAKSLEFKLSAGYPAEVATRASQLADLIVGKLREARTDAYGPLAVSDVRERLGLGGWHGGDNDPLPTLKEYLISIRDAAPQAGATSDLKKHLRRAYTREIIPACKALLALVESTEIPPLAPRIYIPSLRGLRPFAEKNVDHYRDRTSADYDLDKTLIFTGHSLYEQTQDLLLGVEGDRERIQAYREFLSSEVFGKRVELIPRKTSDVIEIKIGNDLQRPLFNLGDGLQSLLTITFPAITAKVPTVLFIEEPETHLHPGMQRRLIELFLAHPELSRHQVFATTHSNHLLDLGADYTEVSSVLFRKVSTSKKDDCSISVVSHDDRMTLQELGVRASSVFLTNATIWVEGVTDRLYLREYLARYVRSLPESDRRFREDIHFSLIEFGGANVAHFAFDPDSDGFDERVRVSKICSNSFVVMDGDTEAKPRAARLRNELGDRLLILQSKEIEHLLPVEILRSYIRDQDGSLNVDDLSADLYQGVRTPLGRILDTTFGTSVFADDSGTIKNKMPFCMFCVDRLRTESWKLTPEAEEVCSAIWSFIATCNTPEPTAVK